MAADINNKCVLWVENMQNYPGLYFINMGSAYDQYLAVSFDGYIYEDKEDGSVGPLDGYHLKNPKIYDRPIGSTESPLNVPKDNHWLLSGYDPKRGLPDDSLTPSSSQAGAPVRKGKMVSMGTTIDSPESAGKVINLIREELNKTDDENLKKIIKMVNKSDPGAILNSDRGMMITYITGYLGDNARMNEYGYKTIMAIYKFLTRKLEDSDKKHLKTLGKFTEDMY